MHSCLLRFSPFSFAVLYFVFFAEKLSKDLKVSELPSKRIACHLEESTYGKIGMTSGAIAVAGRGMDDFITFTVSLMISSIVLSV